MLTGILRCSSKVRKYLARLEMGFVCGAGCRTFLLTPSNLFCFFTNSNDLVFQPLTLLSKSST